MKQGRVAGSHLYQDAGLQSQTRLTINAGQVQLERISETALKPHYNHTERVQREMKLKVDQPTDFAHNKLTFSKIQKLTRQLKSESTMAEELAKKYETMDSVEDKAFNVLLDLELVKPTKS